MLQLTDKKFLLLYLTEKLNKKLQDKSIGMLVVTELAFDSHDVWERLYCTDNRELLTKASIVVNVVYLSGKTEFLEEDIDCVFYKQNLNSRSDLEDWVLDIYDSEGEYVTKDGLKSFELKDFKTKRILLGSPRLSGKIATEFRIANKKIIHENKESLLENLKEEFTNEKFEKYKERFKLKNEEIRKHFYNSGFVSIALLDGYSCLLKKIKKDNQEIQILYTPVGLLFVCNNKVVKTLFLRQLSNKDYIEALKKIIIPKEQAEFESLMKKILNLKANLD